MELSRRNALRTLGGTGIAVVGGSILAMSLASPAAAAQSNWRFCNLCEGLWFNGQTSKGLCPGSYGGPHQLEGSGNYMLFTASDAVTGQTNWRFCHLCKGLWYNGRPFKGMCLGNDLGPHRLDNSGDYKLEPATVGGGQSNWRFCQKCNGLWFNGHDYKGKCAGNGFGPHLLNESGDYQLRAL